MGVRSVQSGAHGLTLWTASGGAASGGGVAGEPDITITSFTPTSTVTGGGSVCTLAGTNYVGPVTITFGETSTVTRAVVDASTITCTIPSRATSSAVTITVTQGSKSATRSNFTYFGVPTITSVAPTSGSTPGGTILTIIGTQFIPSSSTVSMGGALATGATVAAGFSSLTCATPAGSVGTVTLTVQTPSGTATLADAFGYTAVSAGTFVDWRTGTGSAETVIEAGGLLDGFTSGKNSTIVAISSYTRPSGLTNGFKGVGSAGQILHWTTTLGTLAVGATRSYRVYQNCIMTDAASTGDDMHNIQDHPAGVGNVNWDLFMDPQPDGTWQLYVDFPNSGLSFYHNRFQCTSNLSKNMFWRTEWQLNRTSAGSFNFDIRVYDDTDTLRYTSANFRGGRNNVAQGALLSAESNIPLFDVSCLTMLTLGHNGFTGASATEDIHLQAGVAVSDVGWCGAFGTITGES